MSNATIETHRLRKVYGEKLAVGDLSLQVERGEIFGFLGPNGAGKTTSVKMLLGLVQPTSGQGSMLGKPLGDPASRTKIGFLPEHFRFHGWLSATEFLKLHADLYRMSHDRASEQIPALIDLVGLTPHANKRLGDFSKGMLQRIGLAQALLNEPEIVILDEPTSGLDPLGRRLVRDIVRGLRDRGATVFINSHLLGEIEVTCDRVAFIKRGELVRTVDMSKMSDGTLALEIRAKELPSSVLQGLTDLCQDMHMNGEKISLTISDEEQIPTINQFLVNNGVKVYSMTPDKRTLEDLFVQIIGTDEEL